MPALAAETLGFESAAGEIPGEQVEECHRGRLAGNRYDGFTTRLRLFFGRSSRRACPATGGRMLTILDLNTEFAKLKMLRGRTPETPEADREGAFARLAPYRDSAINVAKFSGEGPWERHPNGDEIVQIVDGAVTFHIMTED